MTYWTLLRHRWKNFRRSFQQQRLAWLAAFTMGILGGAFSLGLVITGSHFGFLMRRADLSALAPFQFLNRHLLFLFLSLFSLRLFFQRTPSLPVPAYLSRPLSRGKLIRFFLGYSLLSLHNLFPLLFLVPFWMHFVWGNPLVSPTGALCWGAGTVVLLLLSNYGLLVVRSLLERRAGIASSIIGALIAALSLDTLTGRPLLEQSSIFVFEALAAENLVILAGLIACTLAVISLAQRLLLANLRRGENVHTSSADSLLSRLRFTTNNVLNLVLLEIKLLIRNRRPRHYFLLSLLFGTLYLALMLFDYRYFQSILLEAVIGVFASGVFALNYGQLMFAWDSTYFDGLLAHPLSSRAMVRAKLLVLQGSCVLFFLIGLPFFWWLAPPLVPLHLAFLLYNAGVTSVLVLVLALGNERRVVLSKSGGFFNYEGFSLIHWLWVIPTTVPPILLLYAFQERTNIALIILGGLGALSLLAFPAWSAFFARQLRRRHHMMAEGFRQRE